MLFLGFTGTAIDETLAATISNLKPGGVVMFGRNIKSAPQVAESKSGRSRSVREIGWFAIADRCRPRGRKRSQDQNGLPTCRLR